MTGKIKTAALFAMLALMAGCSSVSLDTPGQAPAPEPESHTVTSIDGKFDGEIIGTPVPGGKLAKVKIGMSMRDVVSLIGAPDRADRHETGKRWIPLYFGTDAQRVEALYKGEGCLTYTGGNVYGEGGAQLIRITVDSTGACFGFE